MQKTKSEPRWASECGMSGRDSAAAATRCRRDPVITCRAGAWSEQRRPTRSTGVGQVRAGHRSLTWPQYKAHGANDTRGVISSPGVGQRAVRQAAQGE